MSLHLDSTKTRIRVRTFAEGLLSRLAHDLELTCRGVSGSAVRRGPTSATAQLVVPIAKIEVAGTLKGGVVDTAGLSPSDREDCLAKMRREVFQSSGDGDVVRIEADVDGGRARVRVIPPNGKSAARDVPLTPKTDGALAASGVLDLSLQELGSWPVKGPMNAFRVKDRVEVLFEVVFVDELEASGGQPA